MKLVTIKGFTLSALLFNILSIIVLTRWKIGEFHLTKSAAICAGICLGWCLISLWMVMFRDWKAFSSNNDSDSVDVDSVNSFTFKKLSDWEKFGVAIIFFADLVLNNTIWADIFIIFFFLYWMITFRIGHQHIAGKSGYKVVGAMLWILLVALWLIFASDI